LFARDIMGTGAVVYFWLSLRAHEDGRGALPFKLGLALVQAVTALAHERKIEAAPRRRLQTGRRAFLFGDYVGQRDF